MNVDKAPMKAAGDGSWKIRATMAEARPRRICISISTVSRGGPSVKIPSIVHRLATIHSSRGQAMLGTRSAQKYVMDHSGL